MTHVTKRIMWLVGAVLVIVIVVLTVAWSRGSTQPVEPLPSEVMSAASNSKYGALWLNYVSYRDSLGSPEQLASILKKKNQTEKEFAYSRLVLILKDKGEKDIEAKAKACLEENFK